MTPVPTLHRHDVAVVGARAAGAATAMLLARAGHDVVVLDRARFPSDTLSTHSIDRSGVVQLDRWGLLDDVLDSGAPAIRSVTFHLPGESLTRTVKDRAGVDHLVAPRRHILDPLLADAAAASGATVALGTSVTGVTRDLTGRATGVTGRDDEGRPIAVDARVVIGADGLRSRVAREMGAPVVESRPPSGTTNYAYVAGLPWDGIEFFLSEGALAGVFPTHGGEACVWVCTPEGPAAAARRQGGSPGAAFDALIARYAPALSERLRSGRRTSPVRSAVRLPNQARAASGRGWALVGDAGYHRDPITGHGISDAFRDADLLATAVDRGLRGELPVDEALAGFGRERDAARREIFDITCSLSSFPPVPEFVDLQRRLSAAIEVEAAALAARPFPRALAA
jgi:2-polyprenyl-6-methoxyphenol hydroxylase-like FAD-dependent oxidoreductase